jgi:hypothetical protein
MEGESDATDVSKLGGRRVGDKLLKFYIVVASVRKIKFIVARYECAASNSRGSAMLSRVTVALI